MPKVAIPVLCSLRSARHVATHQECLVHVLLQGGGRCSEAACGLPGIFRALHHLHAACSEHSLVFNNGFGCITWLLVSHCCGAQELARFTFIIAAFSNLALFLEHSRDIINCHFLFIDDDFLLLDVFHLQSSLMGVRLVNLVDDQIKKLREFAV